MWDPNDRLRLIFPVRRANAAPRKTAVVSFNGDIMIECTYAPDLLYSYLEERALRFIETQTSSKLPRLDRAYVTRKGVTASYERVLASIKLEGEYALGQREFLVTQDLDGANALLGINLLRDFLQDRL